MVRPTSNVCLGAGCSSDTALEHSDLFLEGHEVKLTIGKFASWSEVPKPAANMGSGRLSQHSSTAMSAETTTGEGRSTMRFGSTAKVLLKCKLKYYRISECAAKPGMTCCCQCPQARHFSRCLQADHMHQTSRQYFDGLSESDGFPDLWHVLLWNAADRGGM